MRYVSSVAAQASAVQSSMQAIFWLLVIFAVLVATFVGVMYLRRHLREDEAATPKGGVFDLGELRRMLKQGKLTQEEYDRLRSQIVAILKKDTAPPVPKPKPDAPPEDLRPE